MSATPLPVASASRPSRPSWATRHASALLGRAAAAWLAVTLLGQGVFAAYVLGFYGRAALEGRPEAWNQVLAHGYVRGETFFNLMVGLHLLFAVTIVIGGALQLIPRVRRGLPALHRWNGRAYLLTAAVLSVGGLVMVWGRGTIGDDSQRIAITLNALLIVAFAALAWRHARARRYDAHRRWALRLFMAVSGVWFFRIGLMFWIVVNQGPVGFDPKSFTGPALTTLAFAQFLLPLALLEAYLRARAGHSPRAQLAAAGALGVCTLAMAVGIAAASALMWLPRM